MLQRLASHKLTSLFLGTLFLSEFLILTIMLTSYQSYVEKSQRMVLGSESVVYHVSVEGNDQAGCGSASGNNACKSIQYALTNIIDPTLGGTIVVSPGTYVLDEAIKINKRYETALHIKSEIPYQAHITGKQRVFDIRKTKNVTIEGFEISHHPQATCLSANDPLFEAKRYVIQVVDGDGYDGPSEWHYDSQLRFVPDTDDYTHNIAFRNNIIHDSRCDDLIKLQQSGDVTIENNMFYNQGTPLRDHHIDANSVFNVNIKHNIFFNDFTGSLRPVIQTGPYIVIKDSGNGVPIENVEGFNNQSGNIFFEHPGTLSSQISNTNPRTACDPARSNCDSLSGSNNIKIQSNIFMNWESLNENAALIELGNEDSEFYVALNTLIENNLILGNTDYIARAPVSVKATYNTIFRHNTVIGDFPSKSHGIRTRINNGTAYTKYPNQKLYLYNNIWADHTGTMGKQTPLDPDADFSEATTSTVISSITRRNAYWNNGNTLPNKQQLFDSTQDESAITDDPALNIASSLVTEPPRWEGAGFRGGFATIKDAFTSIASQTAALTNTSPLIDAAQELPQTNMPALAEDILGTPRLTSDIGAYEVPVELPEPEPPTIPTTPPPSGPITIVLSPGEDAFTHESNSDQNYATETNLVISGVPNRTTFLKFNLTNLDDRYYVEAATLKYHINSGEYAGSIDLHRLGTVHSSTWKESTLTHNTKPVLEENHFAEIPSVEPAQVIEVDATELVRSHFGKYLSVVLSSDSADNITVLSRESTNPPQLNILLKPISTATNKFVATYYNNRDLNEATFENETNDINFNWRYGSPAPGINNNRFSARYVGRFDFNDATYTFKTISDDGVRLYIDGNRVIDDWNSHATTINTANINLTEGTHEIVLEYFENRGQAEIKLEWSQHN